MNDLIPAEEASKLERSTSVMADAARSWEVKSEGDVEDVAKYLKVIAESKKTIEERRQFLVRPLNNHVSAINEMFKRFLAPALEADRILRGKIADFRTEQARVRLEEQRRADAAAAALQKRLDDEAAAEGTTAPTVMPGTVLAPPSTIGNASMRKVWKFDVLDDDLVPRDYLVVDETAIRKAVAAGVREIPGVRIYQDEQVTIR